MTKKIAIVISTLFIFVGCGFFPERVKYDDPRLKPMWDAMAMVDREALGFTPIEKDADIRLRLGTKDFDASLQIYGTTYHGIQFRKNGDKYQWIWEQEIHTGPRQYETVDGMSYEQVSITYATEKNLGIPANQIKVWYSGPDTNLNRVGVVLQLDDVRKIISEWYKNKKK